MAAKKTETGKPKKQSSQEKAAKGKQAKRPKAKAKQSMSALNAAAKVLAEAGEPMNCQEMTEAMAAKGYWKSPKGKTPSATLYASILRELETRGKEARFQKVERGRFSLRG